MNRRVMAMLLCLVMLFSLIPVNAFAAEQVEKMEALSKLVEDVNEEDVLNEEENLGLFEEIDDEELETVLADEDDGKEEGFFRNIVRLLKNLFTDKADASEKKELESLE